MLRWNKIIIALVVVGGVIGYFLVNSANDSPEGGAALVPIKVDVSKIGGSFDFTDHTGRATTDKDFRGRYMLIYIGYTFCPDICPTSLQFMAEALDELPEEIASKIVPLFISVDPERDTQIQLSDYVDVFHPRLIGLTGKRDEIDKVVASYRASYRINKKGTDDDTYSVDHTSLTYLMGPDGKYIKHFPYGMTGDVMAQRILKLVK